jgi:hypothetical protein
MENGILRSFSCPLIQAAMTPTNIPPFQHGKEQATLKFRIKS